MAFLTIDGFTPDVMVGSFDFKYENVQDFRRAVDNRVAGLTYAKKRVIEFKTPPLAHIDAAALEGWITGDRHLWTFERPRLGTTEWTRYSSDGGLSLSTGSVLATPLFGSYGLLMASGGTSVATATFGSEGDWTVHCYHRVSSGSFVSYAARSRGGVVDAWADASSAATVRMLSVSAASGFLAVRLHGRDSAGADSVCHFDAVSICRYAMTDQMLTSLASTPWTQVVSGPTRAPFVVVTGDGITRQGPAVNGMGERGGIVMRGSVSSFDVAPVVTGASFQYDARQVLVRLEEI